MRAEYNYYFSQTILLLAHTITIISLSYFIILYVNRGGGAGGLRKAADGRLHRVYMLYCTVVSDGVGRAAQQVNNNKKNKFE